MWIFVTLITGLVIAGVYSKPGQKAIKVSKLLIETLQNNSSKNQTHLEHETVYNETYMIKYGMIKLNTLKTTHHYDVICFTSNSDDLYNTKDIHHYNPLPDISTNIHFTLIRHGNYLGSIPFRPSDFNCPIIYVAIKHMSHEKYSVYKFENKEVINLLDLFGVYENDLIRISNILCDESLAEAYD